MSKSFNVRSATHQAANHRNSAGPMRHRLQPRGGSKKDHFEDDMDDDDDVAFTQWFDREDNITDEE